MVGIGRGVVMCLARVPFVSCMGVVGYMSDMGYRYVGVEDEE
jgi:hypothetical protein